MGETTIRQPQVLGRLLPSFGACYSQPQTSPRQHCLERHHASHLANSRTGGLQFSSSSKHLTLWRILMRTKIFEFKSLLACLAMLFSAAGSAFATFPGHNGLIAFRVQTAAGAQIYTVRPNGKDLQHVSKWRCCRASLVPKRTPDRF